MTTYHYTQERFLIGIEKMTETGPAIFPNVLALGRTPLSTKEKQFMAGYLAANFGPGMPDKRLRVAPLAVDEETASKSIYVSYDIPDEVEKAKVKSQGIKVGANMIDGEFEMRPGLTVGALQAAAISPVDGTIWFSSRGSNSILGLNPKELDPAKRWKNYPVKGDRLRRRERDGRRQQGQGVLERAVRRHARRIGSGHRQADPIRDSAEGRRRRADRRQGRQRVLLAHLGRAVRAARCEDARDSHLPDAHAGQRDLRRDCRQEGCDVGRGLAEGHHQQVVAGKLPGDRVSGPDVVGTDAPHRRRFEGHRLVVCEQHGPAGEVGSSTGRTTDFRVPVQGANPYEAWPDKQDNVWTADQTHSSLIKLDPKTGKWIFYPMPQPRQSVPKIEVDDRNTLWFGTRGKTTVVAVHFYPNGYTADQPPIP